MIRPFRGFGTVALAGLVISGLLVFTGCAAHEAYKSAERALRDAVAEHAQYLAPYEYYSAEAYLREAKKQLEQSDFSATEKFSNKAKARAQEGYLIARTKQSKPMIPYLEGLKYRGAAEAPKAPPVAPTPPPPPAPPKVAPVTPPPAAQPPAEPVEVPQPWWGGAVEEDDEEEEEAAAPEAAPPTEEAEAAVEEEPTPEEESQESIDKRIRRLLMEDEDEDEDEEEE